MAFNSIFSGYDVFISYRRKDTVMKYALNLAEELKKRGGLECFVDETGLSRGDSIPASIRRGIKKSKMFVLLVTEGIDESRWIPEELKTATKRRRKVVPVNFSGEVDRLPLDQKPWDALVDRSRVEEDIRALVDSIPSGHVAAEVDQAFTFTRQKVRRTQILFGVGSVFLGISLLATVSAAQAWRIRNEAEQTTKSLNLRADEARAETTKAQQLKKDADDARDQAKREKDAADTEKATAIKAAGEARQNAEAAEQQAEQANKEVTDANARRLIAVADTMRRERPSLLPQSVLASLESLRLRWTPEGEKFAREGIDLLPRPRRRVTNMISEFGPPETFLGNSGRFAGFLDFLTLSRQALSIYDMTNGKLCARLTSDSEPGNATFRLPVRFSPDDSYFAIITGHDITGNEFYLKVFKTLGGAEVVAEKDIRGVWFSPSGKYMAVMKGEALEIRTQWHTAKPLIVATLPHHEIVQQAVFDPDERFVATTEGQLRGSCCPYKYPVHLWEIQTGRERPSLVFNQNVEIGFAPKDDRDPEARRLLGVSKPDEGTKLFTSTSTSVDLWNINSFEKSLWSIPVRLTSNKNDELPEIHFQPKGEFLVTDYALGAYVWHNWREGDPELAATISHGGSSSVYAVAFSPDGKLLATSSDDGTARVWDIGISQTPVELARMSHDAGVYQIAFAEDSLHLCTISLDKTAVLWEATAVPEEYRLFSINRPPLPARGITKEVRTRIIRNISTEEWKQYFPFLKYHKLFPDLP